MPLVILWLSLVVLSCAKVESIRFGGCWDPHCVNCPSKASIRVKCLDGYVFDETSGKCIPTNHQWSSQYSQDERSGSFEDLKKPEAIFIFLFSLSGFCWMCCCTRNDEDEERVSYFDRQSTNTRRNSDGASNDARENSNRAENSSRMRPPVVPSAFGDNRPSNQTTAENALPLLSSEEYESSSQLAALIVDPDGGYHLGIKN